MLSDTSTMGVRCLRSLYSTYVPDHTICLYITSHSLPVSAMRFDPLFSGLASCVLIGDTCDRMLDMCCKGGYCDVSDKCAQLVV